MPVKQSVIISRNPPDNLSAQITMKRQIFLHGLGFSLIWFFSMQFLGRWWEPTQKQPSIGILGKSCSENMQQIYRKHPWGSVISIKLQSNFIEITLRRRYSPVKLLDIFRTSFYKNTYGGLLLSLRRSNHSK